MLGSAQSAAKAAITLGKTWPLLPNLGCTSPNRGLGTVRETRLRIPKAGRGYIRSGPGRQCVRPAALASELLGPRLGYYGMADRRTAFLKRSIRFLISTLAVSEATA